MGQYLDADAILEKKKAAQKALDDATEWAAAALGEFEAATKIVGTSGVGYNTRIYGRDPVVGDNVGKHTSDARGEIDWGYFVPILKLSKHDDSPDLNIVWGANMGANGRFYLNGKPTEAREIAVFLANWCNSRVEVVQQVFEAALLDEPWNTRMAVNA